MPHKEDRKTIEFSGYISGVSEKRYWKKSVQLGQNVLLVGALCLLPVVIAIKISIMYPIYLSIILASFALVRIPKSKKEKQALLPNRIYIEDDAIVCRTNSGEEQRWIDDVKLVREFDEFYELVFPFGKASIRYICQKNLLTQGSLDEFEALFEGKIINKTTTNYS